MNLEQALESVQDSHKHCIGESVDVFLETLDKKDRETAYRAALDPHVSTRALHFALKKAYGYPIGLSTLRSWCERIRQEHELPGVMQ